MALPWLALPAEIPLQAPELRQQAVDAKLVVEWKNQKLYPLEQKVVYTGGVKATYGVTVITADTLTLFYGDQAQHGIAEGNVHVDDPEGTIDASKVTFDWKQNTGTAERVVVKVDLMTLEAQTIDVKPGRWELTNVKVMECGVKPGLYMLWSPSVIIEPGKRTTAKKISLNILGKKVTTVRRHEVSLDSKAEGLRLPQVSIRRGLGLGVTWQAGVPLTNSTYTSFRYSAFPKRRPSSQLNVSRSLLPSDQVRYLITPRSDLSEYFNYGWLENINVGQPDDERSHLAHERLTVNFGSVMNAGVSGRPSEDSITKPWDIMLEVGGERSGWTQLHQFRLQEIKELGGIRDRRGVVISTVRTPDWQIARDLTFAVRGDGRYFAGEEGTGKWGRLSGEVFFQPSHRFRTGIGYSVGANDGDFAYQFDRLTRTRTAHVRTDFRFGPTYVGLLGKYDPRRREWWDYEFAVRHLAGCFEPYWVWRKSPSTSSFGVRLRVFEAFDRLKDELPKRSRGNVPAPPEKPKRIHVG